MDASSGIVSTLVAEIDAFTAFSHTLHLFPTHPASLPLPRKMLCCVREVGDVLGAEYPRSHSEYRSEECSLS